MPARHRSNPLALAVLICLAERPMHPYEVSTTLRQRQKHESVRLNYGSLYAVVASLEKRGLIIAEGTHREGRLPERTVYTITDAGLIEVHDWLTDLISTPVRDYTAFEAGLSFLPALPPDAVVSLLSERAARLEGELAQAHALGEAVVAHQLPRLFVVEHDYRIAMREAELRFVRELIEEIESGSLDGIEWWRAIHTPEGGPDLSDADATIDGRPTANGSGSVRADRS